MNVRSCYDVARTDSPFRLEPLSYMHMKYIEAEFTKIKGKLKMETIYIPDIYRLMSVTHETIDTFATWSEDLEVRLNSKAYSNKQIIGIMEKLAGYKHGTALPMMDTLYNLLTETVFSVVKAQQQPKEKSVSHKIINIVKKCLSTDRHTKPIKTFDKETISTYYTEIGRLRASVEKHQELYAEIQKQQEVCWATRSKATKYELLLSIVKKSSHSNTFIAKDLQTRDRAICQWQRLFDVNLKTANEAAQKFQELRSKEKISRSLMKKLEESIVEYFVFELTDRISSGLFSLRQILTTTLKQKTSLLLEQINKTICESRSFAESMIHTLSAKYTCSAPREFLDKNGFDTKLPDSDLTNYKIPTRQLKKMERTKKAQQNTNNNEKSNKLLPTDSLKNNSSPCFVGLTRGMVVKQKICSGFSDVVFGWYKRKPWQLKKWSFFQIQKENVAAEEVILSN